MLDELTTAGCPCTGTLDDVVALHSRFQKTFGLSVTASQFEDLILLKAPETVGIRDVFDALDANADGRIDGLEFLAALACVCRATFEEKARCACVCRSPLLGSRPVRVRLTGKCVRSAWRRDSRVRSL